jgi:hypothetical protein
VEAELFHADGETDRYDDANSRFSQFLRTRLITGKTWTDNRRRDVHFSEINTPSTGRRVCCQYPLPREPQILFIHYCQAVSCPWPAMQLPLPWSVFLSTSRFSIWYTSTLKKRADLMVLQPRLPQYMYTVHRRFTLCAFVYTRLAAKNVSGTLEQESHPYKDMYSELKRREKQLTMSMLFRGGKAGWGSV